MTTTNSPSTPDSRTAGQISRASAPPDPKRWFTLAVIAVAQLMVVLDASIINIALPSAQRDLHIGNADRQWVVTAYTLAFGGLLLLGGRIADYTGRKRAFIIGLLGFAAASAVGGAAQNAAQLFGARALQGAFAALLAPAALSLISVTFTDTRERAKAFGVYGGISGGGAALGLVLGGVLTQYANWRWCLFVNVPIAVLAGAAALKAVKESRSPGKARYDLPGAALVTAGLVLLVYGFTEAAKTGVGWLTGSTLTILAAAIVLLAAFVVVEARSRNPLLPLRVLLERNRAGAYLSSLLVGAGLFAMFLFLTYYMQQNLGYSPLRSGFAFLPFSGGIVVAAATASAPLPKLGARPLLIAGGLLGTAGLAYLTLITNDSSWVTHVLPAEIAISLGLGLIFVTNSTLALANIADEDSGVASAMLNTSQQIGWSLGTALLNTLFAGAVANYLISHHGQSSSTQSAAAIHGYHVAFSVGAGLIALATVLAGQLVRFGTARVKTPTSTDIDSTANRQKEVNNA